MQYSRPSCSAALFTNAASSARCPVFSAAPPLQGLHLEAKQSKTPRARLLHWSVFHFEAHFPGSFSKNAEEMQIHDRNKQNSRELSTVHSQIFIKLYDDEPFWCHFWQHIASAVVAYTAKKASGQSQCRKRKASTEHGSTQYTTTHFRHTVSNRGTRNQNKNTSTSCSSKCKRTSREKIPCYYCIPPRTPAALGARVYLSMVKLHQ